ncbi:polysaccharide deacetylase family protein [Cohnella rhizosphaerae]|uniref:Polysaccharide deacetylase family protein n=1 Tax=Cohnella rhizosphaerae TaxID=1457232 RepID=A0A9X4KUX9_9BACL|nr:polysaccharide deacetylase family protein [Cohnella rhizosphaerae]MDG0811382.1 polysaccharide deacetylase family protein [Cohnella rhizosphaerae]
METYSIQVMELLSLGRTEDGRNRMVIAVSREDGQHTYAIDIDELTFSELEALRPLDGGRARLSPYPKWDPYRQTYYSALVRMTSALQDTLYFACSEAYLAQIRLIRQGEPSLLAPGGAGGKIARELPARSRWTLPRKLAAYGPRLSALLLLLLCGAAIFLYVSAGGRADALPGAETKPAGAAETSAPVEPVKPVAARDDVKEAAVHADVRADAHEAAPAEAAAIPDKQAAPAQASLQQGAKAAGYVVVDIDAKKKFFGLPKDEVALTFDDGPSPLTKKIVDILTAHKIAATFLFVGKNAERHPEGVVYAHEHGMSVGNHSWDHSVLTKASAKDRSKNLSMTSSLLESLTGEKVTLFRPPYGAVDDALVSAAAKERMKTLLWNRDPEDWNAKSADDIIRYFKEIEAAGGVYVMHEDQHTVEALPAIIEYLKKEGFKIRCF